jgi:hypothetical protein
MVVFDVPMAEELIQKPESSRGQYKNGDQELEKRSVRDESTWCYNTFVHGSNARNLSV